MCLSPDSKYLLVGTAVGQGFEDPEGHLHFYDTTTLTKVKTLDVGKTSVCGCAWSPTINQIVLGLGNGETHIYLDA
jgi:hypothetical protein